MMEQPTQNPPVDRQYMRAVVGHKGKPEHPPGAPPRKGAKRPKSEQRQPGADYVVELMPYHFRRTTSQRATR